MSFFTTKKTALESSVGEKGEDIAAHYLKGKGFKILKRRYQCRSGEVDVIAERKGEIHFVEVKTRQNKHFGSPWEAVTPAKQARLMKAAQWYVLRTPEAQNKLKVFSVLSILLSNEKPHFEFFENAFEMGEGYY
jgi:putative endonuclease